ncbi:phosphatidylserine decarboxylase [Malassezia cuniculi]|uniref:Phosphatidylserine decarboxylase proenzyme 1, mitochondrial n=1 Tax=Malassezia cuniculi TaxID=948313 RepID=A0AAF0EVY8_9BASI|nr:phosphatidylserine decarboxylase [Malassezia cuniculi]
MGVLRHVRVGLRTRLPRGVRAYARNPDAAQHEASTVRGYRAARSERERLAASSESDWEKVKRTWRTTKTQWKPIHFALGAVVLVGIQAVRTYSKTGVVDENAKPAASGPWSFYLLSALPLNAISRSWGWINSVPLPVWFRPYGFKTYAYLFGCNLDEMAEEDLTKYRSLSEFFYRELKPGARPIADTPMVSPADGRVLHLGTVEDRHVEQVKGMTYSLDSLLGVGAHTHSMSHVSNEEGVEEEHFARINGIEYSLDKLIGGEAKHRTVYSYLKHWVGGAWHLARSVVGAIPRGIPPKSDDADDDDASIEQADSPAVLSHYANVAYNLGTEALPHFSAPTAHPRPGNKLFFCVIYLAPGDYHRFHSPVSWVVEARRHIAGDLYSVSPYVANRLPNLFLLNERVALLGRWRHGFFGMVPVGATNVGSIRINFDRELRTNIRGGASSGTVAAAKYDTASRLLGGQPLDKGDEMGGFLLGSTIVLVFEAPPDFAFKVKAGDKVHVGEALGAVVH